VTANWATTIPLDSVAQAAPLRAYRQIESCVVGDRLWLRGTEWDDDLDRQLRSLLGAERFHLLADKQVVRIGCTVPSGQIPEGPWDALDRWLQLVLPRAILPAQVPARSRFRLVRTASERSANLLWTSLEVWLDYTVVAPQVRLDRLSFATSSDRLALIRGVPLPPLPGTRFVEIDGVAAPVGWAWSPNINPRALRPLLRLSQQDLAVFTLDGFCEVICGDEFVRATRSAVRLTEKEFALER
jgi:hypothetical protein